MDENNVIGMAGTYIAALLQTAGLYRQSAVLNDFRILLTSLGLLLYTFYAVGGIFSVVLFGNYRKGLYFLISPALFYWVLSAQSPACCTAARNRPTAIPTDSLT